MKNINPLKSLFLGLSLLCFTCMVSAQGESAWTTVKSYSKVDIQSKMMDCTADGITTEYEVFKIVNKTNAQVKVKFDMQYFNDTKCVTCGNSEYKNVQFTIPANGFIEGDCNATNASRLKAYKQTVGIINQTIAPETLKFANFVAQ